MKGNVTSCVLVIGFWVSTFRLVLPTVLGSIFILGLAKKESSFFSFWMTMIFRNDGDVDLTICND